ncbi:MULTISPECIES: LysR substrate-binding domain-containing protein [Planktothrix]|jgi:DNA-binding transcriptional LysR family regulator|uniref:LysR substrate-binding domain-containing protein n=2 Tax=Planktothrix TaxID=54304 RepID=A0A4P5ZL28_PLAAG|nr:MULTISPECIES: LysR substrate-binding domain-containing protein [Planktothrix]CAD5955096.1 hypothetical protein NO108_03173 [Planktothrix rubescens]CAC5344069.1 hypothetical protein PLAN_40484 [Planktothrix rubescens NIVA-CYA 18]CAD5911464.1 hypothetical protein PCC7821_00068 [Planktothrix rubescens NIVA-CYA 18]CAH2570632.1 hypothetical protein PRNO82_00019 [Planktothrix rubescens]GDZ96083.1 hypothetical protein PA905_45150 [Planktothrix agardhii CCAP 1459/11A]
MSPSEQVKALQNGGIDIAFMGNPPDKLEEEFMVNSHASMIALVATGQGVAIMPSEAEALPHPQTVFVKLHHPLYYARSTAVWRKETPAQSLDKFLKILWDYIQ